MPIGYTIKHFFYSSYIPSDDIPIRFMPFLYINLCTIFRANWCVGLRIMSLFVYNDFRIPIVTSFSLFFPSEVTRCGAEAAADAGDALHLSIGRAQSIPHEFHIGDGGRGGVVDVVCHLLDVHLLREGYRYSRTPRSPLRKTDTL